MHNILTIDKRRCRGTKLCPVCENLTPGLVAECIAMGEIIIKPWASTEMSPRISQLIRECPDRAIMVRPA